MIAAGTAGGPIWFVVACGLLVAAGVVVSMIRFRQRGPALGYVPRRWRPKVNEWFSAHGWDKPYDENGKKQQPW